MQYNENYRQVAMWIDLNNVRHYQTLFSVQQLVDKLNNDPTNTQVEASFRPYFNMYRNSNTGASSVNLACSARHSVYCIDKSTYGVHS